MTESSRVALSAAGDLTELLWLIAEHEVDTIDAVPIPPLLQQAVDDGLVHWPSAADVLFRVTLTSRGRQQIGLPQLTSSATDGAEWLRTLGRRAFWRF